ncbi:MAG TPA: hypothetical protein VN370_13400, partial [Desulfitobacteriaceae bacterium]|nr:hypothetical protein [Desulfitobacteriaceae bacterium]
MHDYSIELSGDSVTVSGPDGFLISDPTQGFIEFLYASNEEIDTILDLEKDKVDILYDNAASFQFLPFLIWGIYNIDNAAGLTNKKEEILKDLKQQQAYFYEKARIYLDENPPISEYKSLTPRERYVQNNDIGISARCNLSLDRFTLEPVEKYFPEKLEEVFYILFIRMVIRNSTIKRCGY